MFMNCLNCPGNILGVGNTMMKRVVKVIALNIYLFACVCTCVCIYLAYEHDYGIIVWNYVMIMIIADIDWTHFLYVQGFLSLKVDCILDSLEVTIFM